MAAILPKTDCEISIIVFVQTAENQNHAPRNHQNFALLSSLFSRLQNNYGKIAFDRSNRDDHKSAQLEIIDGFIGCDTRERVYLVPLLQKRRKKCWQTNEKEVLRLRASTLIMTDDAWRRKKHKATEKVMNQREFSFFGWSIYRFQSIVECRVLFKTSVRRHRKLPISYMLAAIAKSKCAESYRTGKESRLSTSIFVLVFLFFSSRWIFLDLFRDPEIAVRSSRSFCLHAWRVFVDSTKRIFWSVKNITLRSDESPINSELHNRLKISLAIWVTDNQWNPRKLLKTRDAW